MWQQVLCRLSLCGCLCSSQLQTPCSLKCCCMQHTQLLLKEVRLLHPGYTQLQTTALMVKSLARMLLMRVGLAVPAEPSSTSNSRQHPGRPWVATIAVGRIVIAASSPGYTQAVLVLLLLVLMLLQRSVTQQAWWEAAAGCVQGQRPPGCYRALLG